MGRARQRAPGGDVSLLILPLARSRLEEAREFLTRGGAPDMCLAQALADEGIGGFVGAYEDRTGTLGELQGLARSVRGAIGVAALTSAHAAVALADWLARQGTWASALGAQQPAALVSQQLLGGATAQLDRDQVLMVVTRDDLVDLPDPGVRPAREDDLPQVVPMVARYRVEDGLAESPEPLLSWLEWRLRQRVRAEEVWVLCEGDTLVYTAAFNFRGAHGAGLGGIYTCPEMRGRGIGRAATAALARIALEAAPAVTLHVHGRNEAALRCYRAAGFREAGTLRLTFR